MVVCKFKCDDLFCTGSANRSYPSGAFVRAGVRYVDPLRITDLGVGNPKAQPFLIFLFQKQIEWNAHRSDKQFRAALDKKVVEFVTAHLQQTKK